MTASISATRVATLVGDFDRSPAYAGLADALALLIGDGRIAARHPAAQRARAHRRARRLPDHGDPGLRRAARRRVRRGAAGLRHLHPGPGRPAPRPRPGAAAPAPATATPSTSTARRRPPRPGLAAAYAEAAAELPAYLGGHGYFPAGLPRLQAAIAATYDARGLPTDPDQIMVTPGALSAAAVVAQAFTGPGDRVLVESPVYPNATQALRHGGARLAGAPVDPDGWDLDAVGAALRQTAPRLAYLIPDFQNPTGHLMTDEQREEYAGHLRRAHTVAVVDEAHQALALDGPGDAAAVRRVRPGHDHDRQRQQDVLGRPAARLDPRAARPDGAADPGPGRPRPRRPGARAAGAGRSCSPTPTPSSPPTATGCASSATRSRPRSREHLPEWRSGCPAGGLALWCRAARPRSAPRSPPRPSASA